MELILTNFTDCNCEFSLAFVMKTLEHFAVYYFNLAGITSLKVHGNNVRLSKFIILLNFLLYPAATILISFVFPSVVYDDIRDEITVLKGITKFYVLVMTSFSIQSQLVSIFCIYAPLWKRQEILKLIKNCVTTFHYFEPSSETYKKFKHICLKYCGFSIFLTYSLYLIDFFLTRKITWRSTLMSLLLMFYSNVPSNLIMFLGLFLFYFVFLMESLNQKLTSIKDNEDTVNPSAHNFFSSSYSNLGKLLCEFHKVLGVLLTTIVAFYISTIVIEVLVKLSVSKSVTIFNQIFFADVFRGCYCPGSHEFKLRNQVVLCHIDYPRCFQFSWTHNHSLP